MDAQAKGFLQLWIPPGPAVFPEARVELTHTFAIFGLLVGWVICDNRLAADAADLGSLFEDSARSMVLIAHT